MASLESYGLSPPNLPALNLAQGYLPVTDFFERSAELLESLSESVRDTIVPSLNEQSGFRHPAGYLAYRLGVHAVLGVVTLRIWLPDGLRGGEDENVPEGVHDHPYHIASRAMLVYTRIAFIG